MGLAAPDRRIAMASGRNRGFVCFLNRARITASRVSFFCRLEDGLVYGSARLPCNQTPFDLLEDAISHGPRPCRFPSFLTAKMNAVDPQTYLADVLDRIHDNKIKSP